MNRLFIFLFLLSCCFLSCNNASETTADNTSDTTTKVQRPDFQRLLDSAAITGAILVFDEAKNTYYSNDFTRANTGFIPASTFKIPNTLIALETGVMDNDSTLILWDGSETGMVNWDKDLLFREAFRYSCVPCYRAIAREIGVARMNDYLTKFDYGKMQVDSSNLDVFWLMGASRISQQEQIKFLQKYYNQQLPISKRTDEIAKRMMTVERTENYTLVAKTGRSTTLLAWYVGYIVLPETVLYFATNMQLNSDADTPKRVEVTRAALRSLGVAFE